MRRAAIMLLVALGCASGGSNHRMRLQVFELVRVPPGSVIAQGAPILQLLGPHYLRIRVDNQSEQNVTIHSVKLDPDARETYTDDLSQSIEKTIPPGGFDMFDVILNVYADRHAMPSDRALDYVKIMMSCSNDTTDFVDSGSHAVSHQRSGG